VCQVSLIRPGVLADLFTLGGAFSWVIFGEDGTFSRQQCGFLQLRRQLKKAEEFSGIVHMAVCQNLVPLVNIKIAGIYGCSSP